MSFVKQENTEYYMDPKNLGDGNQGEFTQQPGQPTQITAFLAKLWALVNDSSCDDLITWDPSGTSFHVYDQSRFSKEILPRYFKHNNFASFIRQLNMYGFRKMSTIEHGSLKNERDDIEFAHPQFLRGQEALLEFIKRRAPDSQQKTNLTGGAYPSSALVSANYLDSTSGRPIELQQLLDNVRTLQNRQSNLSDKLSYMQSENQALWTEIGSLRQKHSKQQQIVSKLMEFLVHFITTNSAHAQEQSVDQHPYPNVQPQAQDSNDQLANEHALSPTSLKRKAAALMHDNEPNKRTTAQYPPPNFGRQQSVTINELTEPDVGGWGHTTHSPPLVDLVPSPPLPVQSTDDNLSQQQQTKTFQSVGNGNNSYIPDFFLRTDNPNGNELSGLKTSQASPAKAVPVPGLLKEEQLDYPKSYPQDPLDEIKTSPSLYAHNQQQQQAKPGQPMEQLSFSLDDITGDVDHIQSSLENIRELMFDHLPDGTSIEDLFGEDPELLSPLLQTLSNPESIGNASLDNIPQQTPITTNLKSDQNETTANSQSVPDVNNQLLEQLITEATRVEEQRHTIDQLAREKSDLEDKIHILEQQNKRH